MLRIVRYLSKAEIGQMLVALVSIVGQIWLDLTLPDYMADITQLVETPGSEMRDIWVAGGKMLLVSLGSAACAKSVPQLNERMHAGHWDKATHKSLELGGRTVGLVGLGAIGLRFAKMADALGMRVIGFDPFAKNLPAYVQAVDLETIWRESDAVSLHCPLTDDNRGMLNAATLAQCKRGVIVVNTARGGLIDEADLLAAVRSGQVMAAGLDSFAVEPMTAALKRP